MTHSTLRLLAIGLVLLATAIAFWHSLGEAKNTRCQTALELTYTDPEPDYSFEAECGSV